HPLLLDLLAGRAGETGGTVGYGDVYDVDDPAVAAAVPLLIAEADSSQHSAIVDVMRGNSLAIEGPPGTGKSQTITNLIAAALADRKRVLFIAEKAAALEVVASRLEHAGLKDFCLELHSTKASKKDVLAALDARLALSQQLPSTTALDVARRELESLKAQLNTYCRAINAPFGALGLSAHQILWRAERARDRKTGVQG